VRVLEVREDLQGKIGQPDFPLVQYGVTNPGGEVLAAELVGETLKVLLSHRMYSLNGFRKSTPPQNRQLIVYFE
jgi:hypothetical protein